MSQFMVSGFSGEIYQAALTGPLAGIPAGIFTSVQPRDVLE